MSIPNQWIDTAKDDKHSAELDTTPPKTIIGRTPYFLAASTTRGAREV